jgi:hypothetical protein
VNHDSIISACPFATALLLIVDLLRKRKHLIPLLCFAVFPMTPSPRLVRLPTELLLIIVDLLCETINPSSGGEEGKPTFHFTRYIQSLSLVCRQLRQLCLFPLFSCMKITHTRQLRLLSTKCAVDAEFAGLIRSVEVCAMPFIVDHESLLDNSILHMLTPPRSGGPMRRIFIDMVPKFSPLSSLV